MTHKVACLDKMGKRELLHNRKVAVGQFLDLSHSMNSFMRTDDRRYSNARSDHLGKAYHVQRILGPLAK
ncbi:hypothetical protein D1872_328930 [compost metagenome]